MPHPASVLANRPPPAPFASFLVRHSFLIGNNSTQKYTHEDVFAAGRAAVVRGRVLTPTGQGLRGVRVANDIEVAEGFTLTRADGWFDLLVSGGGPVTLKFGKSPFPYQVGQSGYKICRTLSSSDPQSVRARQPGGGHGGRLPRLQPGAGRSRCTRAVLCRARRHRRTRWLYYSVFHIKLLTLILNNTTVVSVLDNTVRGPVVRAGLQPGRPRLVWVPGRRSDYTASLQLELVGPDLSPALLTVTTVFTVEGRVFRAEHEATPNLTAHFHWDGYSAYGVKHYGLSQMLLAVGFHYKLCPGVVWVKQKIAVHGHIPAATDVGGWTLDVHHLFNPRDNILYRGDGRVIQLDKKEPLVTAVQENFSETVISPVDLVVDRDGTIFLGDSRFLRAISPAGKVTNLLQLNETMLEHRFYLGITAGRQRRLLLSDPVHR